MKQSNKLTRIYIYISQEANEGRGCKEEYSVQRDKNHLHALEHVDMYQFNYARQIGQRKFIGRYQFYDKRFSLRNIWLNGYKNLQRNNNYIVRSLPSVNIRRGETHRNNTHCNRARLLQNGEVLASDTYCFAKHDATRRGLWRSQATQRRPASWHIMKTRKHLIRKSNDDLAAVNTHSTCSCVAAWVRAEEMKRRTLLLVCRQHHCIIVINSGVIFDTEIAKQSDLQLRNTIMECALRVMKIEVRLWVVLYLLAADANSSIDRSWIYPFGDKQMPANKCASLAKNMFFIHPSEEIWNLSWMFIKKRRTNRCYRVGFAAKWRSTFAAGHDCRTAQPRKTNQLQDTTARQQLSRGRTNKRHEAGCCLCITLVQNPSRRGFDLHCTWGFVTFSSK